MENKEIQITEKKNQAPYFNEEQINLIKNQICKGASDDELKLFLWQCQKTNLDPFSRQIYSVARFDKKLNKEVFTVQVSIDGFRLIAGRTGKYRGQVGPFWCGADRKWHDVWLEQAPPLAARVGVLHADFSEPLYAVARFHSYVQKFKDGNLSGLWAKMPDLMIAKCAESLALRKAFPNELSALYSDDEMGQAEKEDKHAEQKSLPHHSPPPLIDESEQGPLNDEEITHAEVIQLAGPPAEHKIVELVKRKGFGPEFLFEEMKKRGIEKIVGAPRDVALELYHSINAMKGKENDKSN